MIAALRATEPSLDASIGTPLRKIIDMFAEALAESYTDEHLINYQYDIDAKHGPDLDDFVGLFGFSRIPAMRAKGMVTFTRIHDQYSETASMVLRAGTQVMSLTSPPVYVQTTATVVMNPGQFTAEAPVQAVKAGPYGNLASGMLTVLNENGGSLTNVTNPDPLSGGTLLESDYTLRERFRSTVFRALAGTVSMYEGVAREATQIPGDPGSASAINKVNVMGSTKRYRQQIQLVNGTAELAVPTAGYIYADSVFAGVDLDAGDMRTPGIDYGFTPTNPVYPDFSSASATVTSLSTETMPDGLYEIDFDYVPLASRNDPGNTRFDQGPVNNRIDLWVNGQVIEEAVQTVVFSLAHTFSSDPTSLYYNQKYATTNPTQPRPSAGDLFIPLALGPVVSIPDSLVIGGTTYREGEHYWICHRDDAFGYAPSSVFGLCWKGSPANAHPAAGATFSVTYNYNRVPSDIESHLSEWRLVGTDAQVHAGKRIPLRFHLGVMYDPRYTPSNVDTVIATRLSEHCEALGFDSPLQISDILTAIHMGESGVDNVRFLNSSDDPAAYAITQMSANTPDAVQIGTPFATGGRARDIQFGDDAYPIFHSVRIEPKGVNSFGVF